MSDRIKMVSGWVLGVLVAAALVVGARSALAHPVTTDCPFDPPEYVGSCVDNGDCTTKCEEYNPPGVMGHCNVAHCCICLL